MFDAGSAVFTLGGVVVRKPFEDYGRLVETARSNKEHKIVLGAQTQSQGFVRYNEEIDKTVQSLRKLVGTAKGSWDEVANATDRMVTVSDSSLASMNRALGVTSGGYRDMAATARLSADSVVASNAKIAESNRAAMGGGGGRGAAGATAATGDTPENQAKKATAAWQKGFGTLATLGKWTSLAFLGTGAVAVKMAADFQKQMELLRTQAQYSQRSVESLKKQVLELAPAVGIGPTKLAEGLYHIASSGIPAAKAMGILKIAAEGAKVGNDDLEHVTNALVAVMRTAPKDIHSTAEAMGVLDSIVGQGNMRMSDLTSAMGSGILPAAKAVGLGLRDVGAALDVMTARGVPAQEGATRLRTVLGLIANPTNKAQGALDQLGFSHDRLAEDFRKKGLVGALTDLRTAMNGVFGQKLSEDQIKQALTAYGQQLQNAGASTTTVRKDLVIFRQELEKNGEGAIRSSQLIAQAFGGARMGTTMQILMQNIGDVRKRFDNLNKDDPAGRFQSRWAATQKTFSQQISEMWAGVQKLGIELGTFLMPKVLDLIHALMDAAKWLGKHKELAEALAYAFGTLLTAAIVAFFARFIKRTADGIISIGKFGKAIYDLPKTLDAATAKMAAGFKKQREEIGLTDEALAGLERQAGATGDALMGVGSAEGGVGGAGSAVGEGPLLGMINGVLGPEAPGSKTNPLAVVVMASEALGVSGGAAAEAKGAAAAEGGGLIIPGGEPSTRGKMAPPRPIDLPPGPVSVFPGGRPGVAASSGLAAAEEEQMGLMGLMTTGAGKAASGLMRGFGVGAMGLMGAQVLGGVIGGKAGKTVSSVGSDAAIGAGLGTMIEPGLGTAIGGALGAAAGAAVKLFGGGEHKDYGKEIAKGMTNGLGGAMSSSVKDQVAKALDDAQKIAGSVGPRGKQADFWRQAFGLGSPTLTDAQKKKMAADYEKAGKETAKALEQGWNSYKVLDEPTIFREFMQDAKKMPPQARDAAAESVINFAREMEKQGKLPKGAASNLLHEIEDQFPEFQKFMGLQGKDTWKNYEKASDSRAVQKNVQNTLNKLGKEFQGLTPQVVASGKDLQTQVSTTWDIILGDTKSKSKQTRQASLGALQQMVADTKAELPTIPQLMKTLSAQGQRSLITNLGNAVDGVKALMHAGVIHTADGMKLINQLLSGELKALTVKIPDTISQGLKTATGNLFGGSSLGSGGGSNNVWSGGNWGSTPGKAGGGTLPGSEFGLGDQMTLVDPHGIPRARMAGDEAVFTRHQMPYVEAGLAAIGVGSSQNLWNSVNRPHGYATGGLMPGWKYAPQDSKQSKSATSHYTALIAAANKVSSMNWPYHWGGGHEQPAHFEPFDCSGAVSYVTQQAGYKVPTTVSGDIGSSWGFPSGEGEVTIFYNPVHTFMKIGNAGPKGIGYFGTSGFARPGGGAGWFDQSPGAGYLTGFNKVHLPDLGAASMAQIRRIIAPGSGPMHDIVQGAVDTARGDANKYLRKVAPTGSAGSGQALAGGVTGSRITASFYTDFGQSTSSGKIMSPTMWGFAELSNPPDSHNWSALGGLPMGTMIDVGYKGRHITVPKIDVGAGGGGLDGTVRAIDLTFAANKALGAPGLEVVDWAMASGSPASTGGGQRTSGGGISGVNPVRSSGSGPSHGGTFARGGWLKGFAGGGTPKLPNLSGWVPGYRPIRVRRGKGGLHVVGGGSSGGSSSGGGSSSSGSHKTKSGPKRTHQPLSASVASLLKHIGLGSFVTDQNTLGKLDSRYNLQETVFETFDGSSGAGLPIADLDTLQGIREQEWDILHKEWLQLPGAIDKLQNSVNALKGSKGGYPFKGGDQLIQHLAGHPAHRDHGGDPYHGYEHGDAPSGVLGMTQGVNLLERDITSLGKLLTADRRKATKIHHTVSAEVMNLTSTYASAMAGYLGDLTAIANKRIELSQERAGLGVQSANIPPSTSSSSSGFSSLDSLVNGVMAGIPAVAPPTSSSTSPSASQHRAIAKRRAALTTADTKLSAASEKIHTAMSALTRQKDADARRLQKEGFDEEWAVQLDEWRLEDRITTLKEVLAKLKKQLANETSKLQAHEKALHQLQDWQSGGLQGGESIIQSLGDIGMDMLDLYQQGADLPTPDRKHPTVADITEVLEKLGVTVPPGLAGGQALSGSAAFNEFMTFQADRAGLFSSFGSNFVPAGSSPFSSPAGLGAGRQFYGAAAGARSGAVGPAAAGPGMAGGGWLMPWGGATGPGGTTWDIDITQHYASGPSDPHTYAQGLGHELKAMQ